MSVAYSQPPEDDAGRPRGATPATPAIQRVPGLRYVIPDDRIVPGLRRKRTRRTMRIGKRFVPIFEIVDHQGARVHDADTLERIRKLAIPPAWEKVWISPHKNSHIQATGRDARGRKQYRYHPRWREERDNDKYARMVAFGKALPALRRRVAADLRREGLPRLKVLATVVRLLETTFIRVGNEEYARANRSFGLTTLQDRHVDFAPGEVRFRFRGKSGVSHQVAVQDARVARIVKRCRDLPGQGLFQYVDEDGSIQTIDSADVNEYIHDLAGKDFTAKDFRTWAGTVLATLALQEIEKADARASGARAPTQKDVVSAIKKVAERLGNTPAVCRKCYVHPVVVASYLNGTLTAKMRRSPMRSPRGAPAGSRYRSTTEAGAKIQRGLRAEEAAVLALLSGPARGPGVGALAG